MGGTEDSLRTIDYDYCPQRHLRADNERKHARGSSEDTLGLVTQ